MYLMPQQRSKSLDKVNIEEIIHSVLLPSAITLLIAATGSVISTSVFFNLGTIHAIIHKTNTNSYLEILYHIFRDINYLNEVSNKEYVTLL